MPQSQYGVYTKAVNNFILIYSDEPKATQERIRLGMNAKPYYKWDLEDLLSLRNNHPEGYGLLCILANDMRKGNSDALYALTALIPKEIEGSPGTLESFIG